MTELLAPETWIALVSLTAMEVVLGIDNIVFLSILVGRLPPGQRDRVRRLGLGGALLSRLGLLFALSWLMGLTRPLLTVLGRGFSGRDLILLAGGLFLIGKSAHEIYAKLEVDAPHDAGSPDGRQVVYAGVASTLVQIVVIDVVFSLDSVITAVGMASKLWIMVAAMVVAMGFMLFAARAIGDFVDAHPSVKILALSFLLLIGVMLVGEALGQHLSKGYVYFSMAFALLVELLNMRFRKTHVPVVLHRRTPAATPVAAGTERRPG